MTEHSFTVSVTLSTLSLLPFPIRCGGSNTGAKPAQREGKCDNKGEERPQGAAQRDGASTAAESENTNEGKCKKLGCRRTCGFEEILSSRLYRKFYHDQYYKSLSTVTI